MIKNAARKHPGGPLRKQDSFKLQNLRPAGKLGMTLTYWCKKKKKPQTNTKKKKKCIHKIISMTGEHTSIKRKDVGGTACIYPVCVYV